MPIYRARPYEITNDVGGLIEAARDAAGVHVKYIYAESGSTLDFRDSSDVAKLIYFMRAYAKEALTEDEAEEIRAFIARLMEQLRITPESLRRAKPLFEANPKGFCRRCRRIHDVGAPCLVANPATEPRDLDAAFARSKKFTRLDDDEVLKRSNVRNLGAWLPPVYMVGRAMWVTYRSNKWYGNKTYNYIHEHDSGVKCYMPGMAAHGPLTPAPSWLRSVETLTLLGPVVLNSTDNDGFGYLDRNGEEVHARPPRGSEIYCIPSGKALLVIQARSKLVALIYGGRLNVVGRGIVG